MDSEVVWKQIPGMKYEASNKGDVRNMRNQRLVKPYDMGGYYNVSAGGRRHRLHRLIAMAFIPNPDNLPEIDHLDGDKYNNTPENLVWDSHRHNVAKHFKDRKNEIVPVCLKYSDGEETHYFESMNEAARFFHRAIGTIYSTLQTALRNPDYRWHGFKIEKISYDEYLEGCVRQLLIFEVKPTAEEFNVPTQ